LLQHRKRRCLPVPFEILREELDLSCPQVDHDQDAYEQLEEYVTEYYVYKFARLAEAEMFVGGKRVLPSVMVRRNLVISRTWMSTWSFG